MAITLKLLVVCVTITVAVSQGCKDTTKYCSKLQQYNLVAKKCQYFLVKKLCKKTCGLCKENTLKSKNFKRTVKRVKKQQKKLKRNAKKLKQKANRKENRRKSKRKQKRKQKHGRGRTTTPKTTSKLPSTITKIPKPTVNLQVVTEGPQPTIYPEPTMVPEVFTERSMEPRVLTEGSEQTMVPEAVTEPTVMPEVVTEKSQPAVGPVVVIEEPTMVPEVMTEQTMGPKIVNEKFSEKVIVTETTMEPELVTEVSEATLEPEVMSEGSESTAVPLVTFEGFKHTIASEVAVTEAESTTSPETLFTIEPDTSQPTSSLLDDSVIAECLNVHNEHRRRHLNTPDLLWDKDVQQSAQEWADYLADSGTFEHSEGAFGENLYMLNGDSLAMACREATEAWYEETGDYDYDNAGFSSETMHFTQVVWKESTKLGVGVARGGGGVYVVAQYSPQGNIFGRFRENVLPLK